MSAQIFCPFLIGKCILNKKGINFILRPMLPYSDHLELSRVFSSTIIQKNCEEKTLESSLNGMEIKPKGNQP